MKTFRLKADATIEAETIDDAFNILGDHFLNLSLDPEPEDEEESPFTSGECTLEPCEPTP
jgi:hypothetical protein